VSANRLAAGVVIVIAAGLFALTFGFEKMPEAITRGFGAEAFPRLVLGTIIVLAVLLAITSPASEPPQPRIAPMVYYSAASLLIFMAVVPVTGMLAAMFLFLVGLGYLWGERRHMLVLSTAALLTAAIWVVFVKGFGVQLPKGFFF
jgi:multisubunit Na+/H+ antiporter MnhB subunit